MSYFTDIDPIGENDNESNCYYCGEPCNGSFCSNACEDADYKENCED